MKYLLDTNICIYLIKRKPASVLARFDEHAIGDIGISTISLAELSYGVQKSRFRDQNQDALLQFLAPLVIAEFDTEAAFAYGRIRAELETQGKPIGSLDTLIAGHALTLGVTIITNNEQEFSRVNGLNIENWVSS
ncbi:MAG: type II toxin-antitoxin system VapC family toxin [Chloroflexota bacterium]|nr:MAG: type II toxin-antitoxin system VapC family toxin [Chloroflexota bacterium]